MSNIRSNARHANEQNAPHLNLKARATSAVVAGCLAVSMCPAIAMAAQPGQGDFQQGGNPPAMQQSGGFDNSQQGWGAAPQDGNGWGGASQANENGDQQPQGDANWGNAPQDNGNWNGGSFQGDAGFQPNGNPPAQFGGQAPEGASDGQAPEGPSDGQAPAGQPMNGNDGIDDQARSYLADEYGVQTSQPPAQQDGTAPADGQAPEGQAPADGRGFAPGAPDEAPELPEGEINVQQFIDNIRDVVRYCSENNVTAENFADDATATEMASFLTKANETRFSQVSDLPTPNAEQGAPAGEAGTPSGEAGTPAEGANAPADRPAQPSGETTAPATPQVEASFLQQIMSFIANLFGFGA